MKNSRSVFVFLLCVVNWVSCHFGAEVQQIGLSNTSTVETSSRIIGGTETTIETYPFAVQINRGNSLVCGGSLLTRQIVLSAAHCFFDEDGVLIDIFHFRVRAGTTNNNSGGRVVRISRLIIHEKYNIPLRDNDIALLQMRFPLTLSDSIGLVEIPKQNFVLDDNTELKQIGWGSTMEDELRMSPVLMEVTVRKVNHDLCRRRYQLLANGTSLFLVTDSMLCAGLLGVGGADACQGDSGGPLLYKNNIVVGVASWGYGCGHPRYPGINVRVVSYTDWISDTLTFLTHNNGAPVSLSRIILLFTLICTILNYN